MDTGSGISQHDRQQSFLSSRKKCFFELLTKLHNSKTKPNACGDNVLVIAENFDGIIQSLVYMS